MKINERKTVLVTGSDGFLGKYLLKELSTKYNVLQIHLPTFDKKKQDDYLVDLTHETSVKKIIESLRDKKIYGIVHLASQLCSSTNAKDWSLLDNNLAITKNMIRLAQVVKPQVFLHASSIAVYPNQDGVYDETSNINMIHNSDCLYGLAKFNSEILFSYFLAKDMHVTHLRIGQIFGPGMRSDRIIPMLIKELTEKNQVTLYGDGERMSNFIHAADVSRAFCIILDHPRSGVFNVVNAKNLTYNQLAEILIKSYGNDRSKIVKLEQGSREKPIIRSEKIKKEFGIYYDELDFSGIEYES